jgi:hypothetical protein
VSGPFYVFLFSRSVCGQVVLVGLSVFRGFFSWCVSQGWPVRFAFSFSPGPVVFVCVFFWFFWFFFGFGVAFSGFTCYTISIVGWVCFLWLLLFFLAFLCLVFPGPARLFRPVVLSLRLLFLLGLVFLLAVSVVSTLSSVVVFRSLSCFPLLLSGRVLGLLPVVRWLSFGRCRPLVVCGSLFLLVLVLRVCFRLLLLLRASAGLVPGLGLPLLLPLVVAFLVLCFLVLGFVLRAGVCLLFLVVLVGLVVLLFWVPRPFSCLCSSFVLFFLGGFAPLFF